MSEPIMNILQSFMGCMYPGSIRTDSIESINDYSEHRYVVSRAKFKASRLRGCKRLTAASCFSRTPLCCRSKTLTSAAALYRAASCT